MKTVKTRNASEPFHRTPSPLNPPVGQTLDFIKIEDMLQINSKSRQVKSVEATPVRVKKNFHNQKTP